MNDFNCATFRAKRDAYQAQRRMEALPILKAQQVALNAKISELVARRGERVNIGLEEDIKQLGFERQYVHGQIAMIEKGM